MHMETPILKWYLSILTLLFQVFWCAHHIQAMLEVNQVPPSAIPAERASLSDTIASPTPHHTLFVFYHGFKVRFFHGLLFI